MSTTTVVERCVFVYCINVSMYQCLVYTHSVTVFVVIMVVLRLKSMGLMLSSLRYTLAM